MIPNRPKASNDEKVERAKARFELLLDWWKERLRLLDIDVDVWPKRDYMDHTEGRMELGPANGNNNWSRANLIIDEEVLLTDPFEDLFESALHELLHVTQWPFMHVTQAIQTAAGDEVADKVAPFMKHALEVQAHKLELLFIALCPADEQLKSAWRGHGGTFQP